MCGQYFLVIVFIIITLITPVQSYTMNTQDISCDAEVPECFMCADSEQPENPFLPMSSRFACLQEHPNRAHRNCLLQWTERPHATCPFCRAASKPTGTCELPLPINRTSICMCTKFKKHGIRLLGVACSLTVFCLLNSQD